MQALGTDFTIATPAFPDNKRTVFKGYLFVGDVLLNESGMQNHPLTPMTDPNLVRVLQAQTPSRVGLIDHSVVAAGRGRHPRDASTNSRPRACAWPWWMRCRMPTCCAWALRLKGMPLVTQAWARPLACRAYFGVAPSNEARRLPAGQGLQAIVSGSCSVATNQQVMDFIKAGKPALPSTRCALPQAWTWPPKRWPGPKATSAKARCWCIPPPSPRPCALSRASWVPRKPGPWWKTPLPPLHAAWCSAVCASSSWRAAKPRVPCAGPGITQMRIGAQIDPGAPWCHAVAPDAKDGLHITLKSGNFGSTDFFTKALHNCRHDLTPRLHG